MGMKMKARPDIWYIRPEHDGAKIDRQAEMRDVIEGD